MSLEFQEKADKELAAKKGEVGFWSSVKGWLGKVFHGTKIGRGAGFGTKGKVNMKGYKFGVSAEIRDLTGKQLNKHGNAKDYRNQKKSTSLSLGVVEVSLEYTRKGGFKPDYKASWRGIGKDEISFGGSIGAGPMIEAEIKIDY